MARHGDDRTGSLVHWFVPPRSKEDRILLFHRKQRAVGCVGLASTCLGSDHPAVLSLRHESARVAKEHATENCQVITH